MRCSKLSQIKESIRSGNSVDEETRLHTQTCPECQSLLRLAEEEERAWGELLFRAALPDGFTERVMASLADVEIENESGERMLVIPFKRTRRTGRIIKKSALWAALLLIVTGTFTLYAQPSIADWVRSIFSNETSDSGMLDARKLGIVQNPHVKVKDKGYALEIDEVVADATRLVMGVKVTDPQGKALVYAIDWNDLHITDLSGNEVAELRGIEGSDSVEKLTFVFVKEIPMDALIVEAHVDRLKIPYTERVVEGNWDFRFKLDMQKANAMNITTPLHEKYKTPDGMLIQMEKLVRTPSGVRLELSTSLSREAAKRSPGGLEADQQLMFHFENEQGEDISSVNNLRAPHMETIISQNSEFRGGKRHWTFTFRYLPYDSQKLRFVFDGYSIPIRSSGSVELVPNELKRHPVVFKDQGDELTLSDFWVDRDPNLQKGTGPTVSLIRMNGKFRNMFNHDEWIVKDSDGKEYPVTYRGSVGWGVLNEAAGDPGFIVNGMGKLPEKATLIRTVTDKWYDNVEWSFELPKGKSIPGLENAAPPAY
ncbi:DUF4179 domain-containing protein [Paenibacillus sp. USDA918EY]|uniref:DUF4179 domain-containing protein n=1 Tax=Paenibacillus sp. USDA918EY TaxID=2689575 RepID=UPI001357A993|nr:DUF4179 domain-containing protein [Paenibacillus sp. USDA918EY]